MSGLQTAILLGRVVLVPLLLGVSVARALGLRWTVDRLGFLAWSWVAGTLSTALVLFAWLWFALPPPWLLDGVLLLVAAGLHRRTRSIRPLAAAAPVPSARWEERLFRSVVAFALVVTALRIAMATGEVVHRADEATFWSFHAKVVFESGGFTPAYEAMSTSQVMRHPDYPLFNPMLQVWTYLHFDRITHVANRVPIQLFSVAVILALASALRRATRAWVAAAVLLIHLGTGYAGIWTQRAHSDVLVGLGALLLLDGWLRHHSAPGPGNSGSRLSLLGACLCLWGKNEGQLVLAGWVAALGVAWLSRLRGRDGLPRPKKAWLAFAAPLVFLALNVGFNARYDYRSDVLTGEDAPTGKDVFTVLAEEGPARVPVVAEYFWSRILASPLHSGYVLLAFLVLVALAPRRIWKSPLGVPALATLVFLLGIFLVFVGTGRGLETHLKTAAARVLFQCVPATFLWVGAMARLLSEEGADGPGPQRLG